MRSMRILTLISATAILCLVGVLGIPGRSTASVTGVPVVDVSKTTLYPPATGSHVRIRIAPGALTIADEDTELSIRNTTLSGPNGPFGTPASYSPSFGNVLSVSGGNGDVIELKATNNQSSAETSITALGFVPAPSDVAPPDFDTALISQSGSATVTVDVGAILDNSFPVSLTLSHVDDLQNGVQAVATSNNGTFNTQDVDLSLPANSGDRIVLLATDDVGNRSKLHFIVGSAIPQVADPSTFVESTSQADSEQTGNEPVSDYGVLLVGREFAAKRTLYECRGRVLNTAVRIAYRSGITYSGPVGANWDWNLDSRIVVETGIGGAELYWMPGDGRKIGPFPTIVAGQAWDSPPGVFRKLTVDANGRYVLSSADGTDLVFDSQTGLFRSMHDYFGNALSVVRNMRGQVVSLVDDLDRKTLFSWFQSGHLASVEDFGGRRVLLDYDGLGRLVRTVNANESWQPIVDPADQDYLYDGLSCRLSEARDDQGRVVIRNFYDGSGKVIEQEDSNNLGGVRISYVEDQSPQGLTGLQVCKVFDAAGVKTVYAYQEAQPHLLAWREFHSTLQLREQASFPGDADPAAWRETWQHGSHLMVTENSWEEIESFASEYIPDESVVGLDRSETEYVSPAHADPRLRSRVRVRRKGLVGSTIEETWAFGGPGDPSIFPTSYTDFEGSLTLLTRDGSGRILQRDMPGVTNPVEAGSYTLSEKHEFDEFGRILKTWNPNRMALGGNTEPSIVYSYHDSGPSRGYLASEAVQASNGATKLETSYEYDLFGNLTQLVDPAGQTWTTEYDLMNRVIRETEPLVQLTHPLAMGATAQKVIEFDYSGADLVEKRSSNLDASGNVGSPAWIKTNWNFDPTTGRLLDVQEDFRVSGSQVARGKVEYAYDVRGDVVKETTHAGDSVVRVYRTSYDSRRLVLSNSWDPDIDGAREDGDELVEWYRYDHNGRVLEQFEPGESGGVHFSYDQYGLKRICETESVSMGGGLSAVLRWEWDYDNNGRLVADRRITGGEGYAWTIDRETRYSRDLAGRATERWEAIVRNAVAADPNQWAIWKTDLYAGGQAKKSYNPAYGPSTFVETVLDDFDRVIEVRETNSGIRKVVYNAQGQIQHTDWEPYNELTQSTNRLFRTAYSYDALGRVVEERNEGDLLAVPLAVPSGTRYAYDGNGALVRKAGFEGSDEGVVSEFDYNLAGLQIRVREGAGVVPWPAPVAEPHSHAELTYTLDGRIVEQRHCDPSATRTIQFEYDGAGRQAVLRLPPMDQGTPSPREVQTLYQPNSWHTQAEIDPNGVTKTYLNNEIGYVLSVLVTGAQGLPHIKGSDEVHYQYAKLEDPITIISDGRPLVASTKDQNSTTSTVEREYGARRELTQESILVSCAGGTSQLTTLFGYDIAGRRTQVEYPVSGPNNLGQGSLRRLYREDGLVSEVQLLNFLNLQHETILTLEYEGRKLARETSYDLYQGGVVSDRLVGLNSRGQVESVTVTDASGSVIASDFVKRSPSGAITARRQTNGNWSLAKFSGPGWLEQGTIESSSSSAPAGPSFITRNRTLNNFGEVVAANQTGAGTSGVSNSWEYGRDDAGFPSEVLTGQQIETIGDQVIRTHPDGGALNPPFVLQQLRQRSHQFDVKGSEVVSHHFHLIQNLAALRVERDVEWSHSYDAWGRKVKSVRSETQYTNGLPASKTATVTLIRDAFGRMVHYLFESTGPEPGSSVSRSVLHAYESGQVIKSIEVNSLCGEESFVETFPSRPGLPPSKSRERKTADPEDWATVAGGAGGKPIASNRDSDGDAVSNGESDVWYLRDFTPWGDELLVEQELETQIETIFGGALLWQDCEGNAIVPGGEYLEGEPQFTFDNKESEVEGPEEKTDEEKRLERLDDNLAQEQDEIQERVKNLREEQKKAAEQEPPDLEKYDQLEEQISQEIENYKHITGQRVMINAKLADLAEARGDWHARGVANVRMKQEISNLTRAVQGDPNIFPPAPALPNQPAEPVTKEPPNALETAAEILSYIPGPHAFLGMAALTAVGLLDGSKSLEDAIGDIVVASASAIAVGTIFKIASKTLRAARRGLPLCFVAGTIVLTGRGEVPIEELVPGTVVLACDEEDGNVELGSVTRKVERRFSGQVVQVVLEGERLEVTGNHRFRIYPESLSTLVWREARHLKPRDRVVLVSGASVPVHGLSAVHFDGVVHNLEVSPQHNYYVGSLGVLVHNDADDCGFSWGPNYKRKIRRHIQQMREKYPELRKARKGGIEDAQQVIEDRVAQGGGEATTYAGEDAIRFEDGPVTYIFRESGEFWTILSNN